VDFSSTDAVTAALALSESVLDRRNLLIKDAYNSKDDSDNTEATATLFVGNLPWDTEEAHIREFFGDCGEILNVRMPIFHDTGKFKG
jgi:RNA recognition motif-containing protein